MMHKHLILTSLIAFLVVSVGVAVYRGAYDSICHEKVQTGKIGNVNYSTEPCSGTYVKTNYLGIPAFYNLPHEGEFGTVAGTFKVVPFLLNVLWIGVVSFLLGLFITPRLFKLKPPIPPPDPSAKK